MGDAFIVRRGGSGGGVQFEVVGGTTQPTGKENLIWVNTSDDITLWVFKADEPDTPVDGMVWIQTSTSSTVEFNALKKNGVWIYPIACKQYLSGAWVSKVAKIYQGGVWKDLRTYLYESGEGAKVTFKGLRSGTVYFFDNDTYMAEWNSSYIGFATQNKVSLRNGQTLYLDAETSDLSNGGYSYTLTISSVNEGWSDLNNSNPALSAGIIQLKFTFDHVNERKVVSLPITITGDYYIGGGCYFPSGATSGNGYRVYNLWLE